MTSVVSTLLLALGAAAAPTQQDHDTGKQQQQPGELKKDVEAMLRIGVPEGADTPSQPDPASNPLPMVLLIGDSISGGYLGGVQAQLKGEAHVVRRNSGGTTIDGLEKIGEILHVIDNFDRYHKLGLIFETKVGDGALLVCTIDLPAIHDHPEARQLLHSLQQYAASPVFKPAATLDSGLLEKLFR